MRTQEEIKKCVEELLSRMTLEEKIGQMVQSAGNDTGMFVGTLADVLHTHTDRLSLIGMPKIGAERWGLHCFTALDR